MKAPVRIINKIIVLLIALGVPLTLLPLREPYGFERSVVLLGVFLLLIVWKLAQNIFLVSETPQRDADVNAEKRGNLHRRLALMATALPVAALLAAPNIEARWSFLINLELWVAVTGVITLLALPQNHSESHAEKRGINPLLALVLGTLAAAALVIKPTGPTGHIRQGLDYNTSLTIASKTLQAAPLWGAGPGRFGESFLRYKPAKFNERSDWAVRYNGSRSGLLEVATEYGLIGLICPIGSIGLILADLNRKREAGGGLDFYLLSGLFGVVVAAFALLPYSPGMFWGLGLLGYLGGGHDEV